MSQRECTNQSRGTVLLVVVVVVVVVLLVAARCVIAKSANEIVR